MRLLFAQRKAVYGARHYLGVLLKGLGARGHVCEIMLRPGPSLGYLRSHAEKSWWLPPIRPLARLQTRRVLRLSRPDVAHIMLCGSTIPLIAACHEAGVPVVVTLLSGKDLTPFLPELERVASIVVLHHALRDQIAERHPILAGKLHLGSKLIDRSLFYPPADPPPANGYRVTYLSRLSRSKGRLALKVMEAVRLAQPSMPGITLTVVGTGTRLLKVRAHARAINREAGREVIRVLGGVSEPEETLRRSDLVFAAGFSAAEGLACHCQIVGLGMAGLHGLVTPDGFQDALAANFGDTLARWKSPTVDDIAAQLAAAYAARADSREWMEDVFLGPLNPDRVLDDYERVLLDAAAR